MCSTQPKMACAPTFYGVPLTSSEEYCHFNPFSYLADNYDLKLKKGQIQDKILHPPGYLLQLRVLGACYGAWGLTEFLGALTLARQLPHLHQGIEIAFGSKGHT